ncbi:MULTISPECIES: asparagine synthase (glutamine-hydrolyzing) [unclassified Bradyrhizobium]|uniref:asparagine synthase (glutamine-hydrolyzing) n=1 Tax=unclassified Bradyrhizobium TaxID=2631580 RepID=UPI0028EB3DEF|nr:MULTISPECIES: asparagine synthase (glutamine-hydrolyzing) [unclassified Bradyrhizobium]
MCGISGVICSAPLRQSELALLSEINGALYHRGPDSDGLFASTHVAMAMRRLSIIDLAGGGQPLYNEDRSVAMVCNGEIYNHHELRSALQARGHDLRTHSDVETIVHGYEDKGEDCIADLRGMFAFAIWDDRKGRLVLGRDRLGEKPLHMLRDRRDDGAERVWWCSELKPLLRLVPAAQRRISPVALHEFLTFQYCLEPNSLIEGVHQLPPGHLITLSPKQLSAEPRPYWSMLDVEAIHCPDPVAQVRDLLDTACRRMGSADVPVGVALSGGIDSSLVAAISAKHYPGQIHAFTIGYKGRPPTDERLIAQRFARSLGIEFTEVEIDVDQMVEQFPQLVQAMDTPIADIAAYGYFEVCRAARAAKVPVLLSGMGGDEFFWGYEWVRNAAAEHRKKRDNGGIKEWARRTFGRGAPRETSILAPLKEIGRSAALSRSLLADPSSVEPNHWLARTRPIEGYPSGPAVTEALSRTWLLCNCLTLLDRMSMAHSIEMRVPFLDIDLINAVSAMRHGGLEDFEKPHKWLLLSSFGHLLPDEVSQRPKQGFTPPVQQWMMKLIERHGPLWRNESMLVSHGVIDGDRLRREERSFPIDFQYKLTLAELWARGALV